MGNSPTVNINEEELKPYLKYSFFINNRPGLKIDDLVNLKKAFIELDTDNDGKIEYDVKKIPNSNNLLY